MAKQNQDENLITLVDEQGNETLYQELFNFHSDDYDKSYILLIPAGSEPEEQVECWHSHSIQMKMMIARIMNCLILKVMKNGKW